MGTIQMDLAAKRGETTEIVASRNLDVFTSLNSTDDAVFQLKVHGGSDYVHLNMEMSLNEDCCTDDFAVFMLRRIAYLNQQYEHNYK